jgi:hypothetical protein
VIIELKMMNPMELEAIRVRVVSFFIKQFLIGFSLTQLYIGLYVRTKDQENLHIKTNKPRS